MNEGIHLVQLPPSLSSIINSIGAYDDLVTVEYNIQPSRAYKVYNIIIALSRGCGITYPTSSSTKIPSIASS